MSPLTGKPVQVVSQMNDLDILDVAPSQDASDQQDYYMFSRESRTKPSFATGILGGGHTSNE